MTDTRTVWTITRAEYNRKKPHDYVGTVDASDAEMVATWCQLYPDWDGRYWEMRGTDRGVALGPVNVR